MLPPLMYFVATDVEAPLAAQPVTEEKFRYPGGGAVATLLNALAAKHKTQYRAVDGNVWFGGSAFVLVAFAVVVVTEAARLIRTVIALDFTAPTVVTVSESLPFAVL